MLIVAAFALFVAAMIFLAVTPADERPGLRIAAAIYIGLPGLATFLQILLPSRERHRSAVKAKLTLQSMLVKVVRTGVYKDDISEVGFHVWMLPRWYRLLIPLASRLIPENPDESRWPVFLRPRLQRLAQYRLDRRRKTIRSFPLGVGIVGRTAVWNPDKVQIVRLEHRDFKQALKSPDEWQSNEVRIHQNLKQSQAIALADRYGQVAAAPLRTTSGDAVGCVTLDLPPGTSYRLIDRPRSGQKPDPLLELLKEAADNLSGVLTR